MRFRSLRIAEYISMKVLLLRDLKIEISVPACRLKEIQFYALYVVVQITTRLLITYENVLSCNAVA